ncbi:MAG: heavy-metal-associated domain-containing protein [Chakrabartia sp.]
MNSLKRFFSPLSIALLCLFGVMGVAVVAQIEGSDRGVAPIDSSSAFEASGITVDVAGKTAEAAQLRGWREAQRRGWRLLWQKTHGGAAPGLSDGALDSIVSAIVVEDEQIGPNRYIARLGVLFDRVRTSEILGVSGNVRRSAPMLVIPVQWSGGFAQSFEGRTEWQKAWARFRTASSTLDYVRVSGAGSDPLLLNTAQAGRPGRKWWRSLLDQYGAADVLVAQVRLERSYPGGPVTGYFSARYGPDNRLLQNFTLRVQSSAALPKLMDEGVRRMDEIYGMALSAGQLRPDTSLIIETPIDEEALKTDEEETETPTGLPAEDAPQNTTQPAQATTSQFTVQFDTPDVASVGATESTIRGIPGMKSVSTSSLALGGVSVMRVSFDGDADMLRVALSARGYRVKESGGSFRIRRAGGAEGQ